MAPEHLLETYIDKDNRMFANKDRWGTLLYCYYKDYNYCGESDPLWENFNILEGEKDKLNICLSFLIICKLGSRASRSCRLSKNY